MSIKLLTIAAAIAASGPYFGEAPPGEVATLFAPGVISTGMYEDGGMVITTDEREVFVRIAQWPIGYFAHFEADINGIWHGPTLAPFSGNYWDGRMAAHPDGKRLFIASPRPLSGNGAPKDHDFWVVERENKNWGAAKHLTGAINSPYDETDLSFSTNGNLYFHRQRGPDDMDVFMARASGDGFEAPEKLKIPGWETYMEVAPTVAADESYIVFTSEDRPGSFGDLDLYVTFKTSTGAWSTPQNLGQHINTPASEKLSTLSPDGKFLFFISDRPSGENWSEQRQTMEDLQAAFEQPGNKRGDMYWVSTEVIEMLRPE